MSKLLKSVVTAILACVLCSFIGMASVSAQEIVGMKMHKTIGLECNNCHVDDINANKNMTPTCVSCHAPGERYYHGKKDAEGNPVLKEYPESGKTRVASFHDSHGGGYTRTGLPTNP